MIAAVPVRWPGRIKKPPNSAFSAERRKTSVTVEWHGSHKCTAQKKSQNILLASVRIRDVNRRRGMLSFHARLAVYATYWPPGSTDY
jgi:hypothetical protein